MPTTQANQRVVPSATPAPVRPPPAVAPPQMKTKCNTYEHSCSDPHCQLLATVKGTKRTYDIYACHTRNGGPLSYIVHYDTAASVGRTEEAVKSFIADGCRPGRLLGSSNKIATRVEELLVKAYKLHTGNATVAMSSKAKGPKRQLRLGEVCDDCGQVWKVRDLFVGKFTGCLC